MNAIPKDELRRLLHEYEIVKGKQALGHIYMVLALVFILPFVGFLVYAIYGTYVGLLFVITLIGSCVFIGRNFGKYKLRLLELRRMGVEIR